MSRKDRTAVIERIGKVSGETEERRLQLRVLAAILEALEEAIDILNAIERAQ